MWETTQEAECCLFNIWWRGGGDFSPSSPVFFFFFPHVFADFQRILAGLRRKEKEKKKQRDRQLCAMCQRAGKCEIIGMKIERRKAVKRSKTDGKLLENRKGCGRKSEGERERRRDVQKHSFFFFCFFSLSLSPPTLIGVSSPPLTKCRQGREPSNLPDPNTFTGPA